MPDSPTSPEDLIRQLEDNNRQLRETCQNQQENQDALEQLIGDTNAKLLRSEMLSMELEQVFSACTDALWVIREDGVVVRANQAMLDLLQKPASEVLGQDCSSLLDYGRCQSDLCPLHTAKNNQQEFDIELQSASGQTSYHILTAAPLVTLDGRPGIVGQFKDITSRKQAEEELAQANAALKRMARIDGLTQIANRRCFDETLQQEWRRMAREGKPLSLLLGDIDYFKRFNDHYGHQLGDDCLRLIAGALEGAILRPADLAARYGGEEFVLLLPDVNLQGALQVGERAQTAIQQLAIEHQASEVAKIVSMSFGATCLQPTAEQSHEQLVALADKALYQAKEQGRNRIIPALPERPDDGQQKAAP